MKSFHVKEHSLSCLIMIKIFSNKSIYTSVSLCSSFSLLPHISSFSIRCTFSSRLRFGGCYMYITAYSIIPQLLHNIKSPDCDSNEYHSRLCIEAFFSFSFSLSRFCSHAYVFSRCTESRYVSRKCASLPVRDVD